MLRHDNFRLLFFATLGSGVGTWMATIALTVDVYDRTTLDWWVSALFIVTFLPSVVVGLVAGPLVDRLSRKRLMVTSDLVRLAVFCALPFVGTPSRSSCSPRVAGIANSFFRPAVLAGRAEPRRRGRARRRQRRSCRRPSGSATAVGPVLGGAIVAASGPHLVYWINAATFLFSALLLVRIPARLLQSEQGDHARPLARSRRRVRARSAVARARDRARRVRARRCSRRASINVAEIFLAKRVATTRGAFGYGLLWTAPASGSSSAACSRAALARATRRRVASTRSRFAAVGGRDHRRGGRARTSGSAALAMVARRLRQRRDVPDDHR